MVSEAVAGMSCFCDQFGKMDIYTTIVLEELFKELLQHHESVSVPSETRQEGIQAPERIQLGEEGDGFEGVEHFTLELAEDFGISDTAEYHEG